MGVIIWVPFSPPGYASHTSRCSLRFGLGISPHSCHQIFGQPRASILHSEEVDDYYSFGAHNPWTPVSQRTRDEFIKQLSLD